LLAACASVQQAQHNSRAEPMQAPAPAQRRACKHR
jgi:hypothetical protein